MTVQATGTGVDAAPAMNELGFYTLAGAPPSRRASSSTRCAAGEAMGLGSTFISERLNIKEAATLSGAAAAVSSALGIATAATNHNTRHPRSPPPTPRRCTA